MSLNVTDKILLQKVRNHPVHIVDSKNTTTSSFIPFCSFGKKAIGAKMKDFDTNVCDIFHPRIYLDQLCYETDLENFRESSNENLKKQLEMGLLLLLDYNEERQINYDFISRKYNSMNESNHDDGIYDDVSIYLDTVGESVTLCLASHLAMKRIE